MQGVGAGFDGEVGETDFVGVAVDDRSGEEEGELVIGWFDCTWGKRGGCHGVAYRL